MTIILSSGNNPGQNCGNYYNTENYYKVVRDTEFETHRWLRFE
jgi:hypothetical protein